ncbi:MAG: T9SS type A sorting domain-containing protein, partial [Hymenobacter sp.]
VVTQPTNFNGTITLAAGTTDGVTDPTAPTLVVAKRADASQPWANAGRSAVATTPTGSVLTSAVFTSFSDFALASTSDNFGTNPLPVTLSSFAARRQASGTVQLAWATASERHSAYFEVQRSLDGTLFTSLEQVSATGTTTQTHHYASLDKTAPAGKLYYRLRQVDTDGAATYSPAVPVSAPQHTLALYPNPVRSQLTVAGAAGQEVRVFDLAGQLRLVATLPASGQLSVAALPPGTYLLRVALAEQARTMRFTKE